MLNWMKENWIGLAIVAGLAFVGAAGSVLLIGGIITYSYLNPRPTPTPVAAPPAILKEIEGLANTGDELGSPRFYCSFDPVFHISIDGELMEKDRRDEWIASANEGLDQLKEKKDALKIIRIYQEIPGNGTHRGTIIFEREGDKKEFGLSFDRKLSQKEFDKWTTELRANLKTYIQVKSGPGAGSGSSGVSSPIYFSVPAPANISPLQWKSAKKI